MPFAILFCERHMDGNWPVAFDCMTRRKQQPLRLKHPLGSLLQQDFELSNGNSPQTYMDSPHAHEPSGAGLRNYAQRGFCWKMGQQWPPLPTRKLGKHARYKKRYQLAHFYEDETSCKENIET